MKYILTAAVLLVISCKSTENTKNGSGYWIPTELAATESLPTTFAAFLLDQEKMLLQVKEQSKLNLPLPDGRIIEVLVENSGTMSPALAEKFPEIKSLQIIENEQVSGRVDINQKGLFAMIVEKDQTYFVNPVEQKSIYYIAYNKTSVKRGINNPFFDQVLKNDKN